MVSLLCDFPFTDNSYEAASSRPHLAPSSHPLTYPRVRTPCFRCKQLSGAKASRNAPQIAKSPKNETGDEIKAI
jgi:hypothetical protein